MKGAVLATRIVSPKLPELYPGFIIKQIRIRFFTNRNQFLV